jgi:hypothetical protein
MGRSHCRGYFTGAGCGCGEAPLKMLFERVAMALAMAETPGAWLGKRRLMAIDGVKLDVPDIPANISGAHSRSRVVLWCPW